jgi:hypothetical protein
MLLAELESLGADGFASDEFVVELRELCERGHAELKRAAAPARDP